MFQTLQVAKLQIPRFSNAHSTIQHKTNITRIGATIHVLHVIISFTNAFRWIFSSFAIFHFVNTGRPLVLAFTRSKYGICAGVITLIAVAVLNTRFTMLFSICSILSLGLSFTFTGRLCSLTFFQKLSLNFY